MASLQRCANRKVNLLGSAKKNYDSEKNIISLIDNRNHSLSFMNPMGLRCVTTVFCFMASSFKELVITISD